MPTESRAQRRRDRIGDTIASASGNALALEQIAYKQADQLCGLEAECARLKRLVANLKEKNKALTQSVSRLYQEEGKWRGENARLKQKIAKFIEGEGASFGG